MVSVDKTTETQAITVTLKANKNKWGSPGTSLVIRIQNTKTKKYNLSVGLFEFPTGKLQLFFAIAAINENPSGYWRILFMIVEFWKIRIDTGTYMYKIKGENKKLSSWEPFWCFKHHIN